MENVKMDFVDILKEAITLGPEPMLWERTPDSQSP
jgi:hypothetical protein